MKKIKFLSVIIALVLICTLCSVTTFAAAATDGADITDGSLADEPTGESDGLTDNVTGDTELSGEDSEPEDATEGASSDVDNVFETLFLEVKQHAGEICSALALVASLILAYCYKCGLMPILQNALNAISGILTGIEKGADEQGRASSEAIAALRSRVECAEEVLDKLGKSIDVMIEDLRVRTEEARGAQDTRLILSAQVDMLYDIFMTSALPQYQKDVVGERISTMRGALVKNDDEQAD